MVPRRPQKKRHDVQELILKEIEHQARKLLRRHRREIWSKNKYKRRYEKRTGKDGNGPSHRAPANWGLHPHFDPVYCLKHKEFLSKVIWRKLRLQDYCPQPALLHEIPKPNGGFRTVMVFSIPDSAIAGLFHRKLTKRNKNIFSSSNYSYRPDRNVFDAILEMKSSLDEENTFVIQYDFEKYFDSISHDYLLSLVSQNGLFLISNIERNVIKSFLTHSFATFNDYKTKNFQQRKKGVPQGSSISLFLSNIAGHELDKDLERHDGQFVRFADDVVAITYKYESALGVREIFSKHQNRSGVKINLQKSPGIRLLDADKEREMRVISDFDYLGHKFTKSDVLLSDRSIERIRNRCSDIIYIHLLQTPIDRKMFNPDRLGPKFIDWDLVTCINELRRYIYGGLPRSALEDFISHNNRIHKMRGLMSFYPLVTSCTQLVRLDGWLLNALERAIQTRRKALAKLGYKLDFIPTDKIISGKWHTYPDPKIANDTQLPSFVYAWRAARKYYIRYGISGISQPGYYSDHSSY